MASVVASSSGSNAPASSTSGSPSTDPFALIERGNAMESSGNLWSAADAFGLASVILRTEASEAAEAISQVEAATSDRDKIMSRSVAKKSATERASIRNTAAKLGQKRKIAALYAEQSRAYLHKARRCLLQALAFETQEDERRSEAVDDEAKNSNDARKNANVGRQLKALMERAEPLVGMLPPSEARRRRRIFGRIYAGGEEEEAEKVAPAAEADSSTAPKGARKEAPRGGTEKQQLVEEKKDEPEAGADDEMEADLLEEMEAEFGSSIPVAPGASDRHNDEAEANGDADLDIPAAPSLPTMPKTGSGTGSTSAVGDGFDIPAAPDDGAGHIEGRGSSSQPAAASSSPPPPHSPGLGPLPPAAPSGTDSATNPNSLEARLAQFDSSLPPEMKSQDERLSDIHRGLGRLGLSLPDNGKKSIGTSFRDHQPAKSEEEQIQEIMDMAADEARMEGGGVDPATVAAAKSGVAASGVEDMDEGALQINDADDLNAVLSKAGLTTSELKSEVSKIEDVLGEDGKKALRDLKDGGQKVADRAQALSLIAAAQDVLFEASAFLEDDEDLDEEEAESMADGNVESDEEGAVKRKEVSKKKKKESDALRKGRAGLMGAQLCLERALASLPSPK